MIRQSLEDVLPLVRHPSRYLGSEVNAVRKDPGRVRLRMALAFPDLYEVGMSHVGTQILYHVLNARDEFAAERVFAPGVDMEAELRAKNSPLCSLESGIPLPDFDIIGFSLLYELNFTNILTILDLSGIPFLAEDRDADPILIAGGPCVFNPEPLAPFFDAVVIGDGEAAVIALAEVWLKWKEGGGNREELLREWSHLRGIYVPSLFEAHWDAKGYQVLTPRHPDYSLIQKALVSDLDRAPYPDHPVVAFGNPVHDRLSLEICRGCTRGCRFCQAGMIYRPVRERAPGTVLSLAHRSLAHTGFEDISLLSLSTGDYGAIQTLTENLMSRCEPERISLSLPSLRIGSLTPELMGQIKRVRKTGFTVAPEAGSERLRGVINKDTSDAAIEETVRNAFRLGWKRIKLYFMIGLPTETEEDLEAIVNLIGRLCAISTPGARNSNLTVSVSTFIPKAHTPFQWHPQTPLAESKDKIHWLRENLKGRGLRFKWHTPEMSIVEGLWARGDRRLGPLLVKAFDLGCRFDGWSDHFHYEKWQEAIAACALDADFYTTRSRDLSEPLPWDHIDSGVTNSFLKEEWHQALAGAYTPDCRKGACNECGVCDFDTVQPVTFKPEEVTQEASHGGQRNPDKPLFKKLRLLYAKQGPARHFGHLELVKIFMRAFRRARIPLRYTEGFHPAPKVSFDEALPVGIQSTEEHLTVEVPLHVGETALLEGVNGQLPEGLTLLACSDPFGRRASEEPQTLSYTVTLKEDEFSVIKIEDFLKSTAWPLTKINRKGRTKTVDLKDVVLGLRRPTPSTIRMAMKLRPGFHVSCKEALKSIFNLSERTLALASIVKEPVRPASG